MSHPNHGVVTPESTIAKNGQILVALQAYDTVSLLRSSLLDIDALKFWKFLL